MIHFKFINFCLLLMLLRNCVALEERHETFEQFKIKFNRTYETVVEGLKRLRIFQENEKYINLHNLLYKKGLTTFKMEVNEYADWMSEEYQNYANGYDINENSTEDVSFVTPANVELPEAVDWRDVGAVTEVKKQNKCGCCWAFAATGALEGQHYCKTGELVSLSEQNLVDCTADYNNHGCSGGVKERAFLYVRDNKGIATEQSYPFEAKENAQCLFRTKTIGATCKGYVTIPTKDEQALKAAVATMGPVAVTINSKCLKDFLFYKEGMYRQNDECDKKQLNHAVLIVGYGKANETVPADYWIVKNSWGSEWGLDGFALVPRNENFAGIATRASFPLV